MTTPPDKRIWLRHKVNGHVGYLVVKGGEKKVKLDREDPMALRSYNPRDWVPMERVAELQRLQLAFVQWTADRQLLKALGDHRRSKIDWHRLTVPERVRFMDEGPRDGEHLEPRKAMWRAIKEATRELIEGPKEP